MRCCDHTYHTYHPSRHPPPALEPDLQTQAAAPSLLAAALSLPGAIAAWRSRCLALSLPGSLPANPQPERKPLPVCVCSDCDGNLDWGITPEEIEAYAESSGGQIFNPREITWLSKGSRPGCTKEFAELEFAATGWFGNEASTDTFYTRTIILVLLPPADERGLVQSVKLTKTRVHLDPPNECSFPDTASCNPKPKRKKRIQKSIQVRAQLEPPPEGAAAESTPQPKRKKAQAKKEELVSAEAAEILSSRKKGRGTQYLIKWKGSEDTEETWEPRKKLDPELIASFEARAVSTDA